MGSPGRDLTLGGHLSCGVVQSGSEVETQKPGTREADMAENSVWPSYWLEWIPYDQRSHSEVLSSLWRVQLSELCSA